MKVMFRILKGEVIALFPEEPGTNDPDTCLSYTHDGQHGHFDVRTKTKPIGFFKLVEAYKLQDEIVRIGYELKVVDRFGRNSRHIRAMKIVEQK